MVETSDRFIIDYLLSSNHGERPKQSPTDWNLNSKKLNRPLTSNDMN